MRTDCVFGSEAENIEQATNEGTWLPEVHGLSTDSFSVTPSKEEGGIQIQSFIRKIGEPSR